MADKRESSEPEDDQSSAHRHPRRRAAVISLIGCVMFVEGLGIYAAMKLFGAGPQSSLAHQKKTESAVDVGKEVKACSVDAYNSGTGINYLYRGEVWIRAATKEAERIEKLLEERKATINDRIMRIVRSSEPKYLDEANLDSLKRQIKTELDKLVEDETSILEVLITDWKRSQM